MTLQSYIDNSLKSFEKEAVNQLVYCDEDYCEGHGIKEQFVLTYLRSQLLNLAKELCEELRMEKRSVKDNEYADNAVIKSHLTRSDLAHFRNGYGQAVKDFNSKIDNYLQTK